MEIIPAIVISLYIAAGATLLLVIKSLVNYTRTGPTVREEIRRHYVLYSIYALLRLAFWSFVITAGLSFLGAFLYLCAMVVLDKSADTTGILFSAIASVAVVSTLQFCRHLLMMPGSIAASSQYRMSRLYPLWSVLSPGRIALAQWALIGGAALVTAGAGWQLVAHQEWQTFGLLVTCTAVAISIVLWATWAPEPKPLATRRTPGSRHPNIVMIGSDTLRADRVGRGRYRRVLTPFINSLIEQGIHLQQCYAPLARTAPSLASLLTGCWTQNHGIQTNYVADGDANLPVDTLPKLLQRAGYRTAAIADWAGADLGKIDFGFQDLDVPEDQWNIKYYIRQGPMDIRLFLSLFTHNRFGKAVLPELYYLASVPLTTELGKAARRKLSELAQHEEPFFLNLFMATTHAPFGSEYPFYSMFGSTDYQGESKFVMTELNNPEQIVKKQEAARQSFDLDQIINLYDGCVRNFDDEVSRIVRHVEECGLSGNTIIVIYSDHGVEFFENNTWGQGNTVLGEDPGARIPIVIVDPRRNAACSLGQTTRSVDLAPTLLDLAGVAGHEPMDGVSLVPALKNPEVNLDLAAFQETGIWLGRIPGMPENHLTYPNILELLTIENKRSGTMSIKNQYKNVIIEARDRMIRCGNWKLVYQPLKQGSLVRLFNLSDDPHCEHDVSAEHPDVYTRLSSLLVEWMRGDGQYTWIDDHLVPSHLANSRSAVSM